MLANLLNLGEISLCRAAHNGNLDAVITDVNCEIRMIASHYRDIAACPYNRAVCLRKALSLFVFYPTVLKFGVI